MKPAASKKILTLLVVLLLIANVATIVVFWLKKEENSAPLNGGPAKFITKELGFTRAQEEKFRTLAQEHQEAIRPVRDELKDAKDNFFSLLSQPDLSEGAKLAAAKAVSTYTEQLDLITLNHFAKVRAMCNDEQKKKFDGIIKQVTQMMAMPQHGPGPNGRPPMDGPHGMPPPPDGQEGMPPPHP
jgi:protein CpxP